MKPEVYRLSYTTLSLYERGDFDAALASFLGKPHPYPTPAMELGKTMHELWERYILENGELPKELGGDKLEGVYKVETKHERLIDLGDNKYLQLVGVIDLECNKKLYDWKVTLRSVNAFVSSKQKWYYKLLVPEAEVFEFRAYNPLLKQTSIARIYFTDGDIDRGLGWAVSLATDFIATLEQAYGTANKAEVDKLYKPQEVI